jgi:hypothetical protein
LGAHFTSTQYLVADGEAKLTHRQGDVKRKICRQTLAIGEALAGLGIAAVRNISLSI